MQVLNLFLALLLNAFGEDSTHDKNSAEAKRLKEARRRIRSVWRGMRNCCCRPKGVVLLLHKPVQQHPLKPPLDWKAAAGNWGFLGREGGGGVAADQLEVNICIKETIFPRHSLFRACKRSSFFLPLRGQTSDMKEKWRRADVVTFRNRNCLRKHKFQWQ